MLKLSSAINSSRLELLSLVTNQQLSDAFFTPFLSHLDSPTLRELQISALGLTRISAPALTEYCISPRARVLDTLKCNGNSLGARAVRSLLATLHSSNFTLQKLEVHANGDFRPYGGGDNDNNDEPEESAEEARTKWAESEQNLESLLVRNKLIRRKVHEQALALLSYARVLFLKSSQRKHPQLKPSASQSSLISNSSQQSLRSSSSPSSPSTFPFLALPIELQQQILALLAPALSASQRARVFNFASNPATLSPALPTLRSSGSHTGCIPDPASLSFSSAAAAAASSDPARLPSPLQDIGCMGIGMGSLGFLPNASSRASPCARRLNAQGSMQTGVSYGSLRAVMLFPFRLSFPCLFKANFSLPSLFCYSRCVLRLLACITFLPYILDATPLPVIVYCTPESASIFRPFLVTLSCNGFLNGAVLYHVYQVMQYGF